MLRFFDIYRSNIYAKNESVSLTYDQAAAVISRYARQFDKLSDQTLVFVLPNSLQSQLLLFAALQVKKVVLINPAIFSISPALYKKFLPCAVVTFDPLTDVANQVQIDPAEVLKVHQHSSFDDRWQHTSLTLLTSGTTGSVKTTVLESSEIEPYGNQLHNFFDFSCQDRLLNLLPFYHGFGLTRIFACITAGASQFIPRSNMFKDIADVINSSESTWTSLVPSQVRLMNRGSGTLHSDFRFATTSAGHCDASDFATFQHKFRCPLLSEYGCTEASIISSNTLKTNRYGSVGVVDHDRIRITADHIVCRPTWRSDAEWIDTGDIGRVDDDGFLWIVGRHKEIIKHNGITFYPQEIEARLKQCAGVEDVAVYVHDHDAKGDLIGIVYAGTVQKSDLMNYVALHLKDIKKLFVKTVCVPELPLIANKLRRLELKKYVDQFEPS